MKKLILIAALFAATTTQAQKIDTVKSAILVKPVLINWVNKDTVYQVTWRLFEVTRDTSLGCNSYVQLYDRKGKQIADKNVPIDKHTLAIWTVDAIIDNYILFALGLEKK
jgi:hypothetical protein